MAPSLPSTASPLAFALTELLEAYRSRDSSLVGREALARMCKHDPAFGRAMAPLKPQLEQQSNASTLMQLCLEQPASSPLRQAAEEVLTHGVYTEPVHVSQSPTPPPRCYLLRLLPSRVAPVLYGVNSQASISVWSSETGAHLTDLPTKRGTGVREFVELPDGTLRLLTFDGNLMQRAPGEESFSRVIGMRSKGALSTPKVVASTDLRHVLASKDPHWVQEAGGPKLDFWLYDLASPRKPRPFVLSGSDTNEMMFMVDATTACVIHSRRVTSPPRSMFTVVDLITGAVIREVRLPDDTTTAFPSHHRQSLLVVTMDEEERERRWRISLAGGQLTEIDVQSFALENSPPSGASQPGLTYDFLEKAIRGPDGALLARYTPRGEMLSDGVHPGPRPGTFVLVSAGDEGTLTLIGPYDPGRREAPAPPPAPLDWARQGAVLTCEIADFDAEDAYTFRLVEADDGLTLAIHMVNDDDGDEEPSLEKVSGALRITPEALERATRFVSIAQGGMDIDDDAPVSDRLPPILLGRELFARLCTGATVPFPTEWTRPEATLTGSQDPQPHSVVVDGVTRTVAARHFEGSDGTLTVLDDPRWPLVLERVEADCFVRLKELKMPREKAPTKSSRARPAPAGQTAAAPSDASAAAGTGAATQRFEATEGGAAKFWEITVEGADVRVRFGKLGATGQTQTKTHPSAEAATREAARLVAEKTKKGYRPAG